MIDNLCTGDDDSDRQRPDTVFKDTTALVRLRVDRKAYEAARFWARFHAGADPAGTAELQLEAYLNVAAARIVEDAEKAGWQCPPEIEALYPPPKDPGPNDLDDGIPFRRLSGRVGLGERLPPLPPGSMREGSSPEGAARRAA